MTDDQRIVYWCSFEHFGVVEHNGRHYLVEWYQDGEIWSDDEYYGTIIIDLNENRYITLPNYLDSIDEINRVIDKPTEPGWWWDKYSEHDSIAAIFNMTNLNYFKDKYNKKEQD